MIVKVVDVVTYLTDIPIKGDNQDKAFGFGVQGDLTLPSHSVFCLFVGEKTEEWLPIDLAPSLLKNMIVNTRIHIGGRWMKY